MSQTIFTQDIGSVFDTLFNATQYERLLLLGDNSIETFINSLNPSIQVFHLDQIDSLELKSISSESLVILNNVFTTSINIFPMETIISQFSNILIIQEITNSTIELDYLQQTVEKLLDFGFSNKFDVPLIVNDFFVLHFTRGNNIDQTKSYELTLLSLSERIIKQGQLLIQFRRDDSKLLGLLDDLQEQIQKQKQLLTTQRIENEKLNNDLQEKISVYEADRINNLRIIENHQLEREKMLRRAEYAEEQWLFWKTKWGAFEDSRSWHFLSNLQKNKKFLLAPVRLIKKIVQISKLSMVVIHSQGYRRFLTLAKQHTIRGFHLNKREHLVTITEGQFSQVAEIPSVISRPQISEKQDFVDIIVCVHNALDDIQICLKSLVTHTNPPYRIILVDDGSNKVTQTFLEEFQTENPSLVSLLRSDEPTGYTFAANRGLKSSTAPFIVLLNSDTIVTSQWLDRMLFCMKSEPGIGIVGPLSNTASWQSVPNIEEYGDWATNPLPEGISVDQMGRIVADCSGQLYPHMPLLNGFCLLINKELINDIGYFDEHNFGPGYGEEDDFIIRARKSNWKTVLADDVYIHHAQSRSYSNERRIHLSQKAGKILKQKHGEEIIQKSVKYCQYDRVLEGIRARIAAAINQQRCVNKGTKFAGKRILFILPVSSPGGGANVVISESLLMMKMGVHIDFYNLTINKELFTAAYPDLPINVIYGNIADLKNVVSDYDAVIATYNPSVSWIKNSLSTNSNPIVGYYVQGYEPLMYPEKSFEYSQAVNSYSLIESMVRFTKTYWTQQMVLENTGQNSKIVGISVNIGLFRPRPRKFLKENGNPLRIMAMIRPEAPYRQPYETMQLLKLASDKYGDKVDICIFGTNIDNPGFSDLPQNFPFKLFGVLPQQKVANLLNEADIFIDFSSHQAMGLTALEAMACGAAVIVPHHGGAIEFAKHEINSLVFTNNKLTEVWEHLQRLVEDDTLRITLQRAAIRDTCNYFPEKVALNMLKVLFGDNE